MKQIKTLASRPVKVFAWFPTAPSIIFFVHGPEDRGCWKDLLKRLEIADTLERRGIQPAADQERNNVSAHYWCTSREKPAHLSCLRQYNN